MPTFILIILTMDIATIQNVPLRDKEINGCRNFTTMFTMTAVVYISVPIKQPVLMTELALVVLQDIVEVRLQHTLTTKCEIGLWKQVGELFDQCLHR